MTENAVIAVIDIGKTNSRVLAIDESGAVLDSVSTKTRSYPGPPYPYLDTEPLWQWLIEQLALMAKRWPISTIVPTTHGACIALMDDQGLVLPVLDYEAEPPGEITVAYRQSVPAFDECFTPELPPCQHMAMHLYWLQKAHSEGFNRARYALPYPQYWAWRLCGVPAMEVSSLGAHTHLWAHSKKDYSSFVRTMHWQQLFPPMRNAWDVLGKVMPEIAAKTGLNPECQILCGVHDSNASLALYLKNLGRDFVLASTGTWAIFFNPTLSLDDLDPSRDMLANIDITGQSVPTARFMGGREFEIIAGDGNCARPSLDDVQRLIANRTMALPNFVPGQGPFPHNKHSIVGPAPTTAEERAALASLYLAMMTDHVLDLLQSKVIDIVIDGAFVANKIYTGLVAALRSNQNVLINPTVNGTAIGASLLASYAAFEKPLVIELNKALPLSANALHQYRAEWLACTLEAEKTAH